MGGTLIKTDIGHGRGWLAPGPAASLRRIDAQLGRPADINEAGRSPEQANENRRKWLAYERYLKGGPWAPKAPYALGADQSVHCWGYAADSDDWYNARAAAVWRDNGWRQTARYFDGKGRPTAKDEPWHGEYSESLDNHRNGPAGGGNKTPSPEEDDMFTDQDRQRLDAAYVALFGPENLKLRKMNWATPDGNKEAFYGVLDITIYTQQLVMAQTGQIAALTAAVAQLKGGGTIDMKALAAAAERGAKDALSGLVLTADVKG